MPRSLTRYREMRDFDATPEPSGDRSQAQASTGSGSGGRFVVHKHAASRLHFDFRLEHDGVLLSWAVPREPTMSIGVRRLALRTEDHPVDYADFEGRIPDGHVGAGQVDIWDAGRWAPIGDVDAALAEGRLAFRLEGERLAGRFALVRMKPGHDDRNEHWLLIRERDETPPKFRSRTRRDASESRSSPRHARSDGEDGESAR